MPQARPRGKPFAGDGTPQNTHDAEVRRGRHLVLSAFGGALVTRNSILKALPCDLRRLPIGALEAFVLSQVHGDAIAEDVAEATGLELDALLKVARHLFELGALSVDGKKHKRKEPTVSPPPASKRRPTLQPASSKATSSIVPPTTVPRPRPHVEVRKLGLGP